MSADVDGNRVTQAYIESPARDRQLKYLALAFILLLVTIGGRKGLKAAVTLILTLLAVAKIILPLIRKPVLTGQPSSLCPLRKQGTRGTNQGR